MTYALMTARKRTMAALAMAAALVPASAALAAGDPNLMQSYAVRLPLTVAAGASLQRVTLPAQVLVNVQSPALSDLRIFNAAGQPVSMALSDAVQTPPESARTTLRAMPIMGLAESKNGAALSTLSVRIDEQQGQRSVHIDSGAATAGGQTVVGALLDARAVADPVAGLLLDVDLPLAQPITFVIQSSTDLKNWQPLAETVLYRAEGTESTSAASNQLGSDRIALPGADLQHRYLRIGWADAAGNPATVTVRGATLTTVRDASTTARVTATVGNALLANAHEVRFTLPFATPAAALDIRPAGDNVLVPIRVLTRNERSQPWTVLANSVVYNMTTGGKPQRNGIIELSGPTGREIKIEAAKNTAGFAAAPTISLLFDTKQIVFLANGAAPYTLAAGRADSASPYLPLSSLMPGYRAGQENSLPRASVAALGDTVVTAGNSDDGLPLRSIVLWAVLAAGVLALGLMAWTIMKQNSKGASQK